MKCFSRENSDLFDNFGFLACSVYKLTTCAGMSAFNLRAEVIQIGPVKGLINYVCYHLIDINSTEDLARITKPSQSEELAFLV